MAFERGDPDRPIIVGRLYNEQNPPPYRKANSTISTVKSDSVGEDGASADGFNELRFEDAASKEQVFLHAQRNLDEVVIACHSTSVGGDQSNSVGQNQTNMVYANRTHTVNGNETATVHGDRAHVVGGVEAVAVHGDRRTMLQANETHDVASNRTTTVGATDALKAGVRVTQVLGTDALSVGATRTVTVAADHSVGTDANYHSSAAMGIPNVADSLAALQSALAEDASATTAPAASAGGESPLIPAISLIFDGAAAFQTHTLQAAMLWLGEFLIIYARARYEERLLTEASPAYAAYRQRVPYMFVPLLV